MILRRMKCWLDGHAYAVVEPLTRTVFGDRISDYVVCLRCLTRGGGHISPPAEGGA